MSHHNHDNVHRYLRQRYLATSFIPVQDNAQCPMPLTKAPIFTLLLPLRVLGSLHYSPEALYHWVISLLQGLGQVMGMDFALVLAAKVKMKVKEDR